MSEKMNPIVSNVITAVATAAVMGVFAWVLGVFSAGSAAIDKEQIRAVLQEELQTDAGQTYSARLAEVGSQVTVLETRVTELKDDVEDLEDIALDLAGGN
jgi:hypothetical protein